MKRLISLVCTLAMVVSMVPATHAAFTENQNTEQPLPETSQYVDQTFDIRSSENYGVTAYEEVNGNTLEKIGNDVYLNGELFLTVEYPDDSMELQPRTGWIRSETWPSDVNASNYNVFEKTNPVNIQVRNAAQNLSADLIIAALKLAGILVGGTAENIGDAIYDYWKDNANYATSQYLYCMETWYSCKTLPYTRRIDCKFYMGKNSSGTFIDYIPDADTTVYASWG